MSGAERITVEVARRILAVEAGADGATLRAAFNKAVKTAHPDTGGSEAAFQQVVEAYRVLEAWAGSEETSAAEAKAGLARLEITPVVAAIGGKATTTLPSGKKFAIRLPPGLRNGDKVAAAGQVLTVVIKGQPDIFISGDDICMTVKATNTLLREGGRVKVKTPGGACLVWIPRQVGTNRIVRVLGRGLPARGRHQQGALILKLIPEGGRDSASKSKLRRFSSDWAAA